MRFPPTNRRPVTSSILTASLLIGIGGEAPAQTNRDRDEISAARKKRTELLSKRHHLNNQKDRAELVRQLREAHDEQQSALRKRARAKGIPLEGRKSDGRHFRLIDFDENDLPVYEQEENVNAAISTAANEVRSSASYDGVTGSSVTIGLWEASGVPRLTHQEFGGRVTVLDGTSSTSSHATHVAGTLIAAGINSSIRGMAPAASISAFTTSQADAEMTANGASAPNTSMLYLSNHSYGVGQGWETSNGSDWVFQGIFTDDGDPSNDFEKDFGRYSNQSANWDGITYNLPYYLVFVSSGNQRGDNPPEGATWTYAGNTYSYDSSIHPKGDRHFKDGWDNMEGRKLAKNVMTVGNAQDAVTNGMRDVTKAVTVASSSRGPTDDGRIKPDITANGSSLLSTDSGSNTDTGTKTGTSMATPNVCGSAALLVDYYSSRFPAQAMRASTLKGLILHTADDDGNPGPDYRYGWGIMNTKAAADVIKQHADNNGSAAILESFVDTGTSSRSHTFGWDGSSPLRVTLCWTDPPGTQKIGHEDRERALVNDLNVRITGPGGTHYPFVMPHVGNWSINSIDDDATTGVNDVDNVEQVYLPSPGAGSYVITVDYAGALTNDMQEYSLIVTGQTAPEIAVEEDGPPVVALVDNSGSRDFGAAAPSQAPVTRTFTIRNTGGSPLNGLAVSKSGPQAGDFSVGSLSASELETGSAASFSVSFDPADTGTRTAALQIASNDADEAPFDINLTATGLSELEAWRYLYFETYDNEDDAADDFDFDKDGLVNLLEFGLAKSPVVSDPDPLTFVVEEGEARLSYPRSTLAMEEFDFEVEWADEVSSIDWSTAGVTELILGSAGTTQQVRASKPMDHATKRFFRLRMMAK